MIKITLEEIKKAIEVLGRDKSSCCGISKFVELHQVNNQYFLVDSGAELGRGSGGTVYDAYSVQINKGEITYGVKGTGEADYVVKVIRKNPQIQQQQQQEIQDETNKFKEEYKVGGIVDDPNGYIIFLEKIKGKEMNISGKQLSKDKDIKSFVAKTTSIVNVIFPFEKMHRNGRIHGDVKSGNILSSVLNKDNGVKVLVSNQVDFGLTVDMKKKELKDKKELYEFPYNAHPFYFPSECVKKNRIGVRSDIFQLVPVIMSVLGISDSATKWRTDQLAKIDQLFAVQPVDQEMCRQEIEKYRDLKNIFNEILQFPDVIPKVVRECVIAFLQQMRSDEYYDRPITADVLKFFTILNNLALSLEKGIDQDQEVHIAKLILLANKLWRSPCDKNGVTFAKDNIELSPEMAKAIISLQESKKLDANSLTSVIDKAEDEMEDLVFKFAYTLQGQVLPHLGIDFVTASKIITNTRNNLLKDKNPELVCKLQAELNLFLRYIASQDKEEFLGNLSKSEVRQLDHVCKNITHLFQVDSLSPSVRDDLNKIQAKVKQFNSESPLITQSIFSQDKNDKNKSADANNTNYNNNNNNKDNVSDDYGADDSEDNDSDDYSSDDDAFKKVLTK